MKREEDLEMCFKCSYATSCSESPMWKKKKQNTWTPSTQTVSNCPRLHPSHLFICHFHADEVSLSVCPICCIFFPLQTISDSFSQLTQMASINFFIKIRIYKSEQFNKPPRERQGATRIFPMYCWICRFHMQLFSVVALSNCPDITLWAAFGVRSRKSA